MSEYLTTGQAARALGLSIDSLQRWAKDGLVTPAFITRGGRYRWQLDDLLSQLGGGQHAQPVAQARLASQVPPPVVLAVITATEGVVIGRRTEPPPPWSFPGAEIEDGETAEQTATRAAREDTGLTIRPGTNLGHRLHPATGRLVTYIAANVASRNHGLVVGDEHRYTELKWASLAEATALMPDMAAEALAHLERVMRRRR
jgi:8-oxo-dGTP diphosphatase